MSNLTICPKCHRSLIGEEAASHKCQLQVGAVSRIVDLTYLWYVDSILPEYGRVVIVKTTDGTLYRLTPTKLGQRKKPTDEGTEQFRS